MKSFGRRLAAGAVFAASFAATPVVAQERTAVEIATVLASNDAHGFDVRLEALRNELRQLRFRSYQLVSSSTRVLEGNEAQAGIELPGGRYLHIITREHTPDHLRLHLLLNEENHPVLNTYVTLEMGSLVLIGGPRDQAGTLVITLGARPVRERDVVGEERALPGPGQEPTPAVSASMPGGGAPEAPAPAAPR